MISGELPSSSMFAAELRLDRLDAGERALISGLDLSAAEVPAGSGREHYAARGLVPGVTVTVLRRGNPMLVAVGHSRWAIGSAEAARIRVAPLGAEHPDPRAAAAPAAALAAS